MVMVMVMFAIPKGQRELSRPPKQPFAAEGGQIVPSPLCCRQMSISSAKSSAHNRLGDNGFGGFHRSGGVRRLN